MNITAFIRELLFSHDCVIIPGFGGFVGNYTPARIDRNSATFYPPVKRISFNRNLNHNDGLLISKISESLKINYSDARYKVEEFVKGLLDRLARGEQVGFDHIGSFVNNHENNVQFEPDKDANYHLDSFGFESFQYMPVEGYDVRKRILRHMDKEPARRSSMGKIMWRAAIVVPILALLVAVSLQTDLFKTRVETSSMNPLVTAEFESNRTALESELNTGSDITKEPVILAPENITVQPEETAVKEPVLTVTGPEVEFCIIIGSFTEEENAYTQVNKLEADGFVPEIIQASNGFYRVIAMKYDNLTKAISAKDSLLKKYPGTWISKKK
ncbi:MAG TPA: SPOR domain-containing protein [Bacteroidales bacterium]|nr:SPOR domain-containing protein [Bacteroidales bacterium]